ncbi:MAG: KTSC domain-containing protein, partial [Acidobacteria bacterium]|nr:KTSC domain-containing protein [Acidobacteriota bacterium]
ACSKPLPTQDQPALLELEFSGGAVYGYFGVPAQVYQELLRAESKGRYSNYHIRNRFAYAKIHPAEPTRSS